VPDLATHVAAAWIAGRAGGLIRPLPTRAVYLFTLGSALPDLLSRAPHLVLGSSLVERAPRPLHTPALLLVICVAASYLFEERGRARLFGLLFLGALFHCLLDFCQDIGPAYGYGWFYPFSSYSPQLSLFSGDRTVVYLPCLLGLAVLVEVARRLRARCPARPEAGSSGGKETRILAEP